MSMPQFINVVIITAKYEELNRLRRKIKVSEPGIALNYFLIALDKGGKRIITPKEIPEATIDLWLTLDEPSFLIAKKQHKKDKANKMYSRGFYDYHFPNAIIKLYVDLTEKKNIKLIEEKIDLIREKFYGTS